MQPAIPASGPRSVFLALVALCGIAFPARAERIDAACTMPWWNMEWNVVALGPIAQGFIAGADRMDFVDLDVAEASWNSDGAELAVRVREGTLSGGITGTSERQFLPDGTNGIVRFRFAPALVLEAGASYVFEVVRTGEAGYVMIRGGTDNPCPGVQGWISGVPSDFADIWFELGRSDAVNAADDGWSALKSRFTHRGD